MARLKVLALLTDGFGARGGIARYNCDLITALAQSRGVEHITILPRFGDKGALVPPRVTQLTPRTNRLAWSCKALQLTLSHSYDLVFCGHLFAAPLAAGLSHLMRIPLWLQLHGIESWQRPVCVVRWAASQARLTTAVSRATRERALKWCQSEPERMRVLPNTIDSQFSPEPASEALRRRFGTTGRKVILTVSRLAALERYKGHDKIIAALPLIRARCPQVLYLIAGEGDDRQRLETLAQQSGVAQLVRFTGPISPQELQGIYGLADVFAMPSTGEGFGIVFLEAAASGLPIVAGNLDGSVDALADGALGTLIDPNDRLVLANAIVAGLGRGRHGKSLAQRFAFANFAAQVDHLVTSRF